MHTVAEQAAGVEHAFPPGSVVTHRERGGRFELIRVARTSRGQRVWLQPPRARGRRRRPPVFSMPLGQFVERYELAGGGS